MVPPFKSFANNSKIILELFQILRTMLTRAGSHCICHLNNMGFRFKDSL